MSHPGVTIVSGPEAAEPDCLHCHLQDAMTAFYGTRPHKKISGETVVDIAQVMGEVIGSGVYNTCLKRPGLSEEAILDQMVHLAVEHMRGAALDLIKTMKANRRG